VKTPRWGVFIAIRIAVAQNGENAARGAAFLI